jgi:hypothetical protein
MPLISTFLLTQCPCFLYTFLRGRGYIRHYFVVVEVDLLSSILTSKSFRSVEERYKSVNYNRNSGFYIRKENIWRLRQRGLLRLNKSVRYSFFFFFFSFFLLHKNLACLCSPWRWSNWICLSWAICRFEYQAVVLTTRPLGSRFDSSCGSYC